MTRITWLGGCWGCKFAESCGQVWPVIIKQQLHTVPERGWRKRGILSPSTGIIDYCLNLGELWVPAAKQRSSELIVLWNNREFLCRSRRRWCYWYRCWCRCRCCYSWYWYWHRWYWCWGWNRCVHGGWRRSVRCKRWCRTALKVSKLIVCALKGTYCTGSMSAFLLPAITGTLFTITEVFLGTKKVSSL